MMYAYEDRQGRLHLTNLDTSDEDSNDEEELNRHLQRMALHNLQQQNVLASGNLLNRPQVLASGNLPTRQQGLAFGNLTTRRQGLASGNLLNRPQGLISGNLPTRQQVLASGNLPTRQQGLASGNLLNRPQNLIFGNIINQPQALEPINLLHQQHLLRSCNLQRPSHGQICQNQCKEIDPREIVLSEKLGEGSFGVVRRGKWRGLDVAVKLMKVGQTSRNEFVREANIMVSLNHPNVVKLYGVSLKIQPIYIMTEFMKDGSLLSYLRKNEQTLKGDRLNLTNIIFKVCQGMEYLEQKNFIHRDLAARNCLISDGVVKVADFGLSRYAPDDIYNGHTRSVFAGKWAAPEVLCRRQFSSKSDVWSFGILMWEVFTYGEEPYGAFNNMEVAIRVTQGFRLQRPRDCPATLYEIMRKCWQTDPNNRPSFAGLVKML